MKLRGSGSRRKVGGSGRGKAGGKGRGRAPRTPLVQESEEEEAEHQDARSKDSDEEEQQQEQQPSAEEEEEEERDGEGDDKEGAEVWLRGPAQLLRRLIPEERRPVIRPKMPKGWVVVTLGESSRKISGILDLLVRLHWSGMIQVGEEEQVSTTWEHYVRTIYQMDPMGRTFNNKAHRVVRELWDFYRCDKGYLDLANRMVSTK